MERVEQAFLAALEAALRDAPTPEISMPEEQWKALVSLARDHKVLPLVYHSFRGDAGAMEMLAPWGQSVRAMVVAQTRKTHDFLALTQRLRAAGIRAVVVKGIVCRELYPRPDLRPSSDEDLLVPRQQYEAGKVHHPP